MAEESIAICPDNPEGYLVLGLIYLYDVILGNTKSPSESLEKAAELANKTIAMDSSNGGGHSILSGIYLLKKEHDKAISEAEIALSLTPDNYHIIHTYASVLAYAGRPEEAIPLFQKLVRLSPLGPPRLYINFAHALRLTGRFEEAVSAYKKAIQCGPNNVLVHVGLTTTYSMMGLESEARAEAAEVLKLNPKFSVDSAAKRMVYKEQSEIDKAVNAMRKAGLK
jgi:adenylate cyclase